MLALLLVPPTGEPRVPLLHVKPGVHETVAHAFNRRFGDHFVLLAGDEAEQLGLLGPSDRSPLARRRFGDYLGVALAPMTLTYRASGRARKDEHRSHHAGLSPDEMRIPLIVV